MPLLNSQYRSQTVLIRDDASPLALSDLKFVKELHADIAIVISQRNSRCFGAEVPLDTHDFRIGLGNVVNVGEREIICYLLTQRYSGGRLPVVACDGRIYLELA